MLKLYLSRRNPIWPGAPQPGPSNLSKWVNGIRADTQKNTSGNASIGLPLRLIRLAHLERGKLVHMYQPKESLLLHLKGNLPHFGGQRDILHGNWTTNKKHSPIPRSFKLS